MRVECMNPGLMKPTSIAGEPHRSPGPYVLVAAAVAE